MSTLREKRRCKTDNGCGQFYIFALSVFWQRTLSNLTTSVVNLIPLCWRKNGVVDLTPNGLEWTPTCSRTDNHMLWNRYQMVSNRHQMESIPNDNEYCPLDKEWCRNDTDAFLTWHQMLSKWHRCVLSLTTNGVKMTPMRFQIENGCCQNDTECYQNDTKNTV